MRNKLTLLLAVLLLAVGWSSTASAQAYVLKADDMKNWTYKWLPQGATDSVAANYVELNSKTGKYAAPEVTDPYQIYDLLRAVYMDKRLPGHFQSAYTSTGTRENPTYYGGIGGGWNIPFGATSSTVVTTYDDIVFQVGANYTSRVEDACVSKIEVIADGVTVSTITASNINSLPEGWTKSGTWTLWTNSSNNTTYFYTTSSTSSLTYNGDLLKNKSSVEVKVTAYDYNYSDAQYYAYYYGYDYYAYIYVNGASGQLTGSDVTYTATIEGTTTGTATTTPTDVLIWALNSDSRISAITIKDGNTTLYSWSGSSNGANLPSGGFADKTLTRYSYNSYYYYMDGGGAIRIPAERFAGHNSITVTVTARNAWLICDCPTDAAGTISFESFNGEVTRTINFPAVVANNTYRPEHEGYTALVVSVKNNTKPFKEDLNSYFGACQYTTKDSVIDYISRNIKSVKLLTDGLRIGAGEDAGTVFNCDGTYNKFFFLGKGRARKKSSGVLSAIGNTTAAWPNYACEEVPFKYMYEQFSPTSGDSAAQITDFYIEMMDGAVYPIVHDCASVIQNGHQFSMSGNKGTQQYAMSGMNFFIPDYRLKFFTDTTSDNEVVDGRDMNPYMYANANGKTDYAFSTATPFAVNYAQYNPQHPPRVGLYLLTLDAEAFPCEGYDVETNPNYTVTLDWTSSLNEMSGGDVPQKYVIYEVTYDENGNEVLDSIDIVTNETFYDFKGKKWPQHDYSETHTYIIKGWPTDSDHPSFIAWSNQDNIIIPGLKDFLALALDHYESDFDVPKMQNWYRNFLNVKNENDANGLTTDRIHEGYNVFNLMRYEDRDSTITTQVAQIVFENMPDGTVKYTINYVDENGTPTQDIEAAKYELSAMNIPTTGTLTVVADGDIIIQPNGYDVNFLKIQVQAGNYNKTWTASDNSLPAGWSVSNGSQWLKEDGAYYLEGNGYILIPASTIGNYTTATVTINAFGDTGKTAKIKVNGESTAILNGEENAKDYIWTIGGSSKAPASPKRIIPSRKDDSRNKVNTNNN
jgi:hypothetical protein